MSTSIPPFFKDYEPAPSTSPSGPPRRDRRALLIVALLIGLLAVAATVLVVVLVRDSDSPGTGGLAPRSGVSAGIVHVQPTVPGSSTSASR